MKFIVTLSLLFITSSQPVFAETLFTETAEERLDAAERASKNAQTEVCEAIYWAQESSALKVNRGFPGPKAVKRLQFALAALIFEGPTVLTAESVRLRDTLISGSAGQISSGMSYLLEFIDCSEAAAPEVAD